VSGISLKTAIRHRIKALREDAGREHGESGCALDYHADQLDFLLLTEEEHRDPKLHCHPGCPWCVIEGKPTHNRITNCLHCAPPVEQVGGGQGGE
jgi:hypothetical protein